MNPYCYHDSKTILAYIIKYKAANGGNSPSYREITEQCGIKSTSIVDYLLSDLERGGMIRRTPGVARSIEIVGATWSSGL